MDAFMKAAGEYLNESWVWLIHQPWISGLLMGGFIVMIIIGLFSDS